MQLRYGSCLRPNINAITTASPIISSPRPLEQSRLNVVAGIAVAVWLVWLVCIGPAEARRLMFEQWAAVDTLDRALKLMLRHKIIMTHTIAMLPLLVRALRVRYQELSESSPREASKFLRRAKRLGRRTSWIALRFPVDRAAALREYGLVCEVSGKGAKAIKLLEKSCKVAERQHETRVGTFKT